MFNTEMGIAAMPFWHEPRCEADRTSVGGHALATTDLLSHLRTAIASAVSGGSRAERSQPERLDAQGLVDVVADEAVTHGA